MKALTKYISRYFATFLIVVFLLLLVNLLLYGITFQHVISEDYGDLSPSVLLDQAAEGASPWGLSEEICQTLQQQHIWAMYLSPEGDCVWALDLPAEVPQSYTLQDVALFSKGYIEDYPVFVRNQADGLLILGYPKDSYMKLTSNYYSLNTVRKIPLFAAEVLGIDMLCLFILYFFSRRRIIKNTEPIVHAVEALASGDPVSLHVDGDLSDLADSVRQAGLQLDRQNTARANWISGISHDIRTPLSMIMGYADRIAKNSTLPEAVRDQSDIIRQQSIKIKELIRDLNLVSQLEYAMQPLHTEPIRPARLLRTDVAELLNSGMCSSCTLHLDIAPDAENTVFDGDARLISRAVGNLLQNSIRHNPQGCNIWLFLKQHPTELEITVQDDGCGLSPDKLKALTEKAHYLESTDRRLDLRHGLGLLIVRQIADAHHGRLIIKSCPPHGCTCSLYFPLTRSQ